MPTVPTRAPVSQITERALPAPQLTARSTGDNGLARGLQNVASVAGDFAIQQRKKADATAVREGKNNARLLQRDLLLSEESGYYRAKGKDAIGALESTQEAYTSGISKIRDSLQTEEQRAAFDEWSFQHSDAFNNGVLRHHNTEQRSYGDQQFKASLSNITEEIAYNSDNPQARTRLMADLGTEIADYVENNGIGEEAAELLLDSSISGAHRAVLDGMLARDDNLNAKAYLTANREDMQHGDIAAVEKVVTVGVIKDESRAATTAIVTAHDTLEEQLAAARKIKDTEVSDETVRRIKLRHAEEKQFDQDRKDDRMLKAADVIDGGGSTDEIDKGIWSELTLTERSNLETYYNKVNSGADIVTDFNLYYELEEIAGAPDADVAEFKKRLLANPHRLSAADKKHFGGMLRTMQNKKDDSGKLFLRNKNQTVTDIWESGGAPKFFDDDADKEKTRLAQFRRRVDEIVRSNIKEGTAPTVADYEQAAKSLMIEVHIDDIGPNRKQALFLFNDDDFEADDSFFISTQKQDQLRRILKANGKPTDAKAVQRLYIEELRVRRGQKALGLDNG